MNGVLVCIYVYIYIYIYIYYALNTFFNSLQAGMMFTSGANNNEFICILDKRRFYPINNYNKQITSNPCFLYTRVVPGKVAAHMHELQPNLT